MCRLRQVCNVYTQCGHAQPLPDEVIQCDNPNCKFSTTHPATCVPPQCTRTCWQYRQYPEQYSPHIDRLCPACSGGARRR
ncbi:hypothetical protein BDQ17DRAFT_1300625 [Cyathus striatus]|nr:hypothetical protein BDQ17DRAFT_1300625 [Cyathus striatus]